MNSCWGDCICLEGLCLSVSMSVLIHTSLEQSHAPDSRVMFIYIFNGICTSLMDLEVTLDLSGSVKYWCWFGWSTGNLFLIAKTNLSPFLGTPGAERSKEIRGDHVGKKAIICKLQKSYASATRTWLCSPTLPARKVNDARALWWQQYFSDEKWGWFSGITVPPFPESPISQCLSSVHTAHRCLLEKRGVSGKFGWVVVPKMSGQRHIQQSCDFKSGLYICFGCFQKFPPEIAPMSSIMIS